MSSTFQPNNKVVRKSNRFLAALFIFIFAALIYGWKVYGPYGPDIITVVNSTPRAIPLIQLRGHGFKREIRNLQTGTSTTVSVSPAGESGLEILFDSPQGVVKQGDLAYLCGCRLHYVLTIQADYQVKTKTFE
jgi:hypothetical protein